MASEEPRENVYRRPQKRNAYQKFKKMAGRINDCDLDEEMYQYIVRVSDQLHEGFQDEEQKEIFANNVSEELSGKAIDFACSKIGSRVLEKLIPILQFDKFHDFSNKLTSDLRIICSHPQASHVCESVLDGSLKWLGNLEKEGKEFVKPLGAEDDNNENSTQLILKRLETFTAFIVSNISEFIFHQHASHVIRRLIGVLCGECRKEKYGKPNPTYQKEKGEDSDVKLGKETKKVLNSLLKNLYSKIVKLDMNDDIFLDPNSSCVIQELLVGLHKAKPKLCSALCEKIKDSLFANDDDDIPSIVKDQAGSHLVEKLITYASDELYEALFTNVFKNHIVKMAYVRSTSFVLQQLIVNCRTNEQFEVLLSSLMPELGNILGEGHTGIISGLAEKCVNFVPCQDKLVKSLMETFGCVEPKEAQLSLCALILQISSIKSYNIDTDKLSKNQSLGLQVPIQLHGSLIVQSLLKYETPSKVVTSLLSLSLTDLTAMCCNVSGSRVIDAMLDSDKVKEKSKARLLHALKGNFSELACNKFGSRVLEKLWKFANFAQKLTIAEELVSTEGSQLSSSMYGRILHSKFYLDQFRNRPEEWKQFYSRENKKRKLFHDFLGGMEGGDNSSVDPGNEVVAKKKYKKKSQNWYN